jgi:hypothetical protein
MAEPRMIDVALSRIVFRDGADRQYIFLSESAGTRGFPIVIGNSEAGEIQRVVHGIEPERPLTHQLAFALIEALGASIQSVDIVDLKQNTFYARIVLRSGHKEGVTVVDARPSDAIALALRSGAQIRVAETVLERASDTNPGP